MKQRQFVSVFYAMPHAKAIRSALSFRKHLAKSVGHFLVAREASKVAPRVAFEGVLLAVILSVAAQLLYPNDRALPQTRIGGKDYAYQSKKQIVKDIARLHEQKMHIASAAQTLSYTPKELGITFMAAKDVEQALNYSWRERLIPFSLLQERREVPYLSFIVDESKARKFVESLKRYDKAPVDAVVELKGTGVSIVKQQNGYTYDADSMVEAVKRLEIGNSMSVELQPKTVQPNITDQAAAEAASAMKLRLQKPITVQAAGKSATAGLDLLASWIKVTPDAEDKKLRIDYDKDKIKQWLAEFAPQVYMPGTPRTVILLDGAVTGGNDAADGRALNTDATAEAVIAAAAAGQQTAEGKLDPVVRTAQTIRNYTRSSQGLQALLDYWDASNAGTWGVVIKDFDGKLTASLNASRQFTSASVYKIYVAYVVYSKVDSGEYGMGAPVGNGNTVSGCLDLMIVRSDNDCAQALGNLIGWSANDGMLHAKGLGSTSIAYGGQLTTAQDAASYLMQLENGLLLSGGSRDALLYKMGHNIYRYAIPAGSLGVHSANKLGALGIYSHDVAIVYHPKGKYVLTVFTQGSNHARIRELARQISSVMNQ